MAKLYDDYFVKPKAAKKPLPVKSGGLQTMGAAELAAVRDPRAHVGGDRKPPKTPISAAAARREPGDVMSFLVTSAPKSLVARLERARSDRRLRSRNEAVLAILDEGAPK